MAGPLALGHSRRLAGVKHCRCPGGSAFGATTGAGPSSAPWLCGLTSLSAGQLRVRDPEPGRYADFSQTDTCCLLSLVKGARVQSLQRSRKVMPASRAMRSSSDGHT